MYTDNFEEEILFTPARKDGEACNHLKIVTAFTDVERISSICVWNKSGYYTWNDKRRGSDTKET